MVPYKDTSDYGHIGRAQGHRAACMGGGTRMTRNRQGRCACMQGGSASGSPRRLPSPPTCERQGSGHTRAFTQRHYAYAVHTHGDAEPHAMAAGGAHDTQQAELLCMHAWGTQRQGACPSGSPRRMLASGIGPDTRSDTVCTRSTHTQGTLGRMQRRRSARMTRSERGRCACMLGDTAPESLKDRLPSPPAASGEGPDTMH